MQRTLFETDRKPRLAISFSGGRSSARMAAMCFELYGDTHEIKSCFMNTGYEDERTLEFVDAADEHIFNGELVWLEAVIHGSGIGPTAKVVDFETASRNGEPFKAAVAKHGVFGPTHKQCNSRLKTEPMRSWRKSEGWEPNTYDTAIGIRADEADRCSATAKKQRLIYPLVEAGITKADVNRWCAQFDWDLKLPGDHFGNCVWCWKKSIRKLMTVAKENPHIFDGPGQMERKYGMINKGDSEQTEPRVFFRNRMSAQDVVVRAFTEEFTPYSDAELQPFDETLDVGGGCGDSCEIGADE